MITKKTVLVLGAGVSYPYGYPVGLDLYHQICDHVRGKRLDFLLKKGFDRKYIERFVNDLETSQLKSIDLFLLNRPEYLEIGKIAIAFILLHQEYPTTINKEYRKIDSNYPRWRNGIYSYIFRNMVDSGWEKFGVNAISFITFNYDRSLEQFLFNALKATSDKDDETVAEMMKSISIIHTYGSLGPLPWQNEKSRPYSRPNFSPPNTNIAIDNVINTSKNIRLIYEPLKAILDIPKFTEAKRIYFLGFSYHESNMKVLNLKSTKLFKIAEKPNTYTATGKLSPMCGNAYTLGYSKIRTIEKRWKIHIPKKGLTDLEFLQNVADFD